MPLRHMDYVKLKAIDNQWMQKKAFLELPLSDYKQKFLRSEDFHKYPLQGVLQPQRKQKVSNDMSLHNPY